MKGETMTNCKQKQAGFTLVELAIVMIIIGLLIGGVLKGQALISNAQTTATLAQIKAFDTAITTFRDQYATLPGDMTQQPAQRLHNCGPPSPGAAFCDVVGNGDGRIDVAVNTGLTFGNVDAGEQLTVWGQLSAAGLITGINAAAPVPASWGGAFPATKFGNNSSGYSVGWASGTAALNNSSELQADTRAGTYLAIHRIAGQAPGGDPGLTPNQAQRIDSKIDDGIPSTGTVAGSNGTCVASATVYNEQLLTPNCVSYIQIQD